MQCDHVASLLFADDVGLMAPSVCDIKHSLDQFTTRSEGNDSLPKVKEFNYLGVLFKREGTMEWEIGRRMRAAGAVLLSPY